MSTRPIAGPLIGVVAFGAGALLSSCSTGIPTGEHCGGDAACACPHSICTDLTLTTADAGKMFRLAVGEWVSLRLADRGVAASASSSDERVLKMSGKPRTAVINLPIVIASFNALRVGSARLTFGYLTCPTDQGVACSYEVDVTVIQFPKAAVTVDNVFTDNHVRLRVGEVLRINGAAGVPQTSPPSIDARDVVDWVVDPMYLDYGNMFQAAVKGLAPGTAHIDAGPCSSTAPVCTNPWRLTVIVT